MRYFIPALKIIGYLLPVMLFLNCGLDEIISEDFTDSGKRTNPFDPEYGGPTGSISGKAVLDQQPLTDSIYVELRFSSDVSPGYTQISHRNEVPVDWNDSKVPRLDEESGIYTDSDGNFTFSDIPIGTYIIRTSLEYDSDTETSYNSAWVANIVVTDGAQVQIDNPILLTERVDGKILFLSNRDGFTEFYKMNSDGTQQERLTFNGIVGWQDDDIAFKSIDYHDPTNELVFLVKDGEGEEGSIATYNLSNGLVDTSYLYSGNDVCWGPNGSIYYSDYEGIWKIASISDPNPTQVYEAADANGIPYLDVSIDGKIAFIESAYMYEVDDSENLLYSEVPLDESSDIKKVDRNGNLLDSYDNIDDLRNEYNLPFLLPVEQIKVLDNDQDEDPVIFHSSNIEARLPFHNGENIVGIIEGWEENLEWGLLILGLDYDDDGWEDIYYGFFQDEILNTFRRTNSIWGIEWSPDGENLAFCDFYIASRYERYFEYEWVDPTWNKIETIITPGRVWYDLVINEYDSNAPDYIGYNQNDDIYNYAYDSFTSFSIANPIWSSDGSKVVFLKGLPGSSTEDIRFDDIFLWTDIDIWIMDSENSFGNGPQKQLTFNPNKDFSPIWIP